MDALLPLWLIIPVVSGLAVLVLLLLFRQQHRLPQDWPNSRSLHIRPTPRIGGLALVPAILVGAMLFGALSTASLLILLTGVLFFVSAVDDRRGLGAGVRFLLHAVTAFVFVTVTSGFSFMLPLIVLAMVWMVNLYNFMDGADGLAGGMAVVGFGALAWAAGGDVLTVLGLSVAAAAAGFLIFNFPPAKVFMGDAGSVPLGFLASALGWWGMELGHWPVWFPILVFSPFVVDATLTLLRRLFRGEKFWLAHRDHCYQRLVRMGWSHRQLAKSAYVLMFCTSASALLLLSADSAMQWLGCAAWAGGYWMLVSWVDRRWQRQSI